MYRAFDKFLATDTWHTTHPLDTKRFYQALDQVVRDDAFNANAMADYMFQKVGVSRGADDSRAEVIERFTVDAWAIQGYLNSI
jgi:hypothetical protein